MHFQRFQRTVAGDETAFAIAGLARRLFEVEPGARPLPPLLDEDGEAIRREFGALSEEPVQSAEDGRARDEG